MRAPKYPQVWFDDEENEIFILTRFALQDEFYTWSWIFGPKNLKKHRGLSFIGYL